jgi:hypothetical protein
MPQELVCDECKLTLQPGDYWTIVENQVTTYQCSSCFVLLNEHGGMDCDVNLIENSADKIQENAALYPQLKKRVHHEM